MLQKSIRAAICLTTAWWLGASTVHSNLAVSSASDGTLRRIYVPILMYHYVSELPAEADSYRIDLTIHPETFRQHLQYLQEQGYETISLYDLHDALMTGAALPARPIILTFDDGYSDHYTTVLPLLLEYGYTATFFIITGKADMNETGYLSWAQIAEMSRLGMDMEPHTKNHVDLRARSYDYLVYQIVGSIESLEAFTEQEARMFAYPVGRYDDHTLEVIQSMPIWRAVTTQHGAYHTTDNYLEMPRLRIHGNMGVAGLGQLLASSR